MFFLEVGYKIKKKRRGGMSMRKKMKLFIAMVSVGVLLGTIPVMAAEQPELPTKVQDIANGSDDLYGEGVPIEHGANPDERFSSGGVDHTHQYIVANALKILSNDQGNSAFNGELNSSILMEATDWPDKLGNETDAGTFAGHFYDPDSGKNWLGQTSPTARTRAESYFQEAVNAYRAGDVQLAMSNLGKGTHYVSDLNEPHHASNLTAVNSNHSAFEKYVDKNRKSYTIAGNSFNSSVYTTALNTSTGDLMYSAAKHAKGLAANAQNESTYDSAGRRSVQHAIQTVSSNDTIRNEVNGMDQSLLSIKNKKFPSALPVLTMISSENVQNVPAWETAHRNQLDLESGNHQLYIVNGGHYIWYTNLTQVVQLIDEWRIENHF